MYTFDSRVRYSETDESGNLSLTGMMNYLQDCSTLQSEDLGMGLEYLKNKNRAWWLNSWQILISRYPKIGERITVGTWPYEFKGIYGFRNFVILDGRGEYLVKANSCWFFYDLEKNCPTRVTEEEIRGYGAGDPKLDMEYAPRKILLPKEYREGEPVIAGRHHIDTNHHVNNAQYVEIARELIPSDMIIRELRVEYKNAAVLGDNMIPRISTIPEGYVISLCSGQGKVYANIWLSVRKRGSEV